MRRLERDQRRCMTRTVLAIAAAACGTPTPAPADGTTRPAMSCAVLCVDGTTGPLSDLATLAEARLEDRGDVTLVDRQNAGRVLDERQLVRLLAPEAVTARAEAGRLLRADVLAVVRARGGGRAECVVCETRQGVRLARVDLDPAKPDGAADAIAAAVRDAAGKIDALRHNALPLVAVPPFVSGDLTFENDYLRDAYARLAEAAVAGRGGVAVELSEADALAAEAMLADGGAPLRRASPVYLHGEFRNARVDGRPQVDVSVRAVRGRDALWAVHDTLPPDRVPALIARAGERAAGAPAPQGGPDDPAVEVTQLAGRAEVSLRLGDWSEAAALLEAALLLRPDDAALHRRAVVAYAGITAAVMRGGGEATMQTVRDNRRSYFRGLDHVESYLARATAQQLKDEKTPGRPDFIGEFFHSSYFRKSGHPTPEVTAAFTADRDVVIERLLDIVERRARGGQNDDYRFLLSACNLTDDTFALAWRAIQRVQDLPGLSRRVLDYGTHGYTPNVLDTPEGRQYLDRVETLPSAEAKSAARQVRAMLPQFAAAGQRLREQFAAATRPIRPTTNETSTYRRVLYQTGDAGRGLNVHRLVAAGPGTDVLLSGAAVLVSRAEGRATPLWQSHESNVWPDALCYDGRYAWATFKRFENPPVLLRIDPVAGSVVSIAEPEGLPQPAASTLAEPKPVQELKVVPLSPGRVMLVGYFGRTYLAIADTDAAGRTRVDVFHEAREQLIDTDKEQWRRTTVAFQPSCLVPLVLDKGPDGRRMIRVIVGRGRASGSYLGHPLVVDPEAKTVGVIEDDVYLGDDRAVAVRDGTMYFAWPNRQNTGDDWSTAQSSATVWRMALPDLRQEKVCDRVYPYDRRCERFACAFWDGRFVVAGVKTQIAATPAGPYTPAGSTLPFSPRRSAEQPLFTPSSVYGLLLQMEDGCLYEPLQFAAGRP